MPRRRSAPHRGRWLRLIDAVDPGAIAKIIMVAATCLTAAGMVDNRAEIGTQKAAVAEQTSRWRSVRMRQQAMIDSLANELSLLQRRIERIERRRGARQLPADTIFIPAPTQRRNGIVRSMLGVLWPWRKQ